MHHIKFTTHFLLNSLLGTIKQKQSLTSVKQGHLSQKWSDYINNLWHQEHLQYLWEVTVPFIEEPRIFEFNPETGLFGYQYSDYEEPDQEYLFIESEAVIDLGEELTADDISLQYEDNYGTIKQDEEGIQQEFSEATHDGIATHSHIVSLMVMSGLGSVIYGHTSAKINPRMCC